MDEGRWKKVREDLEAVLTGKVKGEALVAARPRGDSIAAWRTPAVPTEVKIDNDVSRDFTVLEIVTEDRAGVLYAMTRTLFNESLDIHRSKIATEANRAIDVFYVRDKANLVKITDPERMVRLKTTLLDLLAER
jgi:[protein-PII] uridylyltransferase